MTEGKIYKIKCRDEEIVSVYYTMALAEWPSKSNSV